MSQTITSIQDKSPEELNVICAELCGVDPESHWWCPTCKCDVASSHVTYEETHDVCFSMVEMRDAPPYATSYDAIMPCVKALTDKQTFAFIEHLRVIRNIQATGDFAFTWLMMTSSEADLTRALIMTLTT